MYWVKFRNRTQRRDVTIYLHNRLVTICGQILKEGQELVREELSEWSPGPYAVVVINVIAWSDWAVVSGALRGQKLERTGHLVQMRIQVQINLQFSEPFET